MRSVQPSVQPGIEILAVLEEVLLEVAFLLEAALLQHPC